MPNTFRAIKRPMAPWKIMLIILGVIVAIPVVVFGGSMIISPIFDHFDKAKFDSLDKSSQAIFEKIKYSSFGSETWTYTRKCDPELAGDWPTGKYDCSTEISTEVTATNVDQLTRLHNKYYAIIDNSAYLKPRTQLDKEFPDEFGIKFVVSGAEKKYSMVGNDVVCTYFAGLTQSHDTYGMVDDDYSTEIKGGQGIIMISLTCSEIATGDWYQ